MQIFFAILIVILIFILICFEYFTKELYAEIERFRIENTKLRLQNYSYEDALRMIDQFNLEAGEDDQA